MLFPLAGNPKPLALDGCVDRYTCRTPHFHMQSYCTAQTTCAPDSRSLQGSSLSCVPKKLFFIHPASHGTLNTSISSLSSTSPCVTFVYLSDSGPVVHASIHPLQKIHGRMALPRNIKLSQELEEQVLSPNESRINIVRIARQARNYK